MTPLQRRQFGKLVAASLTSTVVADISSKAFAQQSDSSEESLFGVNISSVSNITSDTRNRESQTPSVELNTATLPTGKVISANQLAQKVVSAVSVVSKVTLQSLPVENLSAVKQKPQPRAFFLADSDRIAKAVVLGDKTVVIATVSSTRNGENNYLTYSVGSASKGQFTAKKVLDFENPDQTLESLVSLPNNQLLCLIGTRGIPPFYLKTIDFTTGKILSSNDLSLPTLPNNHRFANLCQDAKGNIFATEISSEGIPILISMNLQEKATVTGKVKIKRLTTLSINGQPLINDVKDLGFSASGQLYALATDSSRKNNTTGKILSSNDLSLPTLPNNHRFANLCQDAKGNIFATEISSEGIPILISMNLQEKATVTGKVKIKRLITLSINGQPLINDVKDLGFSASGQLYALATDSSRKNNVMYTVDVGTGKMESVKNFAVEKFVFSP